jgi:hypothetical protein
MASFEEERVPNYWLTTHWPPCVDEPLKIEGVFLKEQFLAKGARMRVGDLVIIHQNLSGDPEERDDKKVYRARGRDGIIGIVEVIEVLDRDPHPNRESYGKNKSAVWHRRAHTKAINTSGFVPRLQANELLGYEPGNRMRFAGGLVDVERPRFEAVVAAFAGSTLDIRPPQTRKTTRVTDHPWGGGGEGPEHEALKKAVCARPASLLGEAGLKSIDLEYSFPTGDTADVILRDRFARYVAVEVEVDVRPGDLCGLLQAVKYRHMYAVMCKRPPEEIRAFLVAHTIAKDIKELCAEYGVEVFEVPWQ